MSTWTTLVPVAALAQAIERDDAGARLAIVDARFALGTDSDAGLAAYRQAHIPGARYAHLERDLSGPHVAGAGRHPWPRADDFASALGRLGIGPGAQVVVYDDAQGALAAARLWFLLKAWGHADVAVLDGGWRAWLAEGGPVESAAPHAPAAKYPGRFNGSRLLDAGGVQALLDAGGLVVDARAPERFRGEVEPLDRVAGHIPGAENRPFTANLGDGRFKSPDQLRAGFLELLRGRSPAEAAVSCGSGVTACHHLLAMEHAGLPGPRLYTGSWSGWIEDPARPIATG